MTQQEPTRRERLRKRTIDEVLAIALRQLAESGAGAISLNAIARELGMTGPALYRYFPNRDALITELVIRAYHEFGDVLWEAVNASEGASPVVRLRAQASAYRTWALANPHRYQLLFGTPVPGYQAPAEQTRPAAERMLTAGLALTEEIASLEVKEAPESPAEQSLTVWARENGIEGVSGVLLGQLFSGWTRLHGVLSLELAGHFGFGLPDPALLYEIEVESLVRDLTRVLETRMTDG